jgi:hypothetical protein
MEDGVLCFSDRLGDQNNLELILLDLIHGIYDLPKATGVSFSSFLSRGASELRTAEKRRSTPRRYQR